MSSGGFIDSHTFHPTLGIPQGCALSAIMCALIVNEWSKGVAEAGSIPESYVDDRTLYSEDSVSLERAWAFSKSWDKEYGWSLNEAKTQAASIPPHQRPQLTYDSGKSVPYVEKVQTLGHEVPFHYRASKTLQRERTDKAIRTCMRLEPGWRPYD